MNENCHICFSDNDYLNINNHDYFCKICLTKIYR